MGTLRWGISSSNMMRATSSENWVVNNSVSIAEQAYFYTLSAGSQHGCARTVFTFSSWSDIELWKSSEDTRSFSTSRGPISRVTLLGNNHDSVFGMFEMIQHGLLRVTLFEIMFSVLLLWVTVQNISTVHVTCSSLSLQSMVCCKSLHLKICLECHCYISYERLWQKSACDMFESVLSMVCRESLCWKTWFALYEWLCKKAWPQSDMTVCDELSATASIWQLY